MMLIVFQVVLFAEYKSRYQDLLPELLLIWPCTHNTLKTSFMKVLTCTLQYFYRCTLYERISFHLLNLFISESCSSHVADLVQSNIDHLSYICSGSIQFS